VAEQGLDGRRTDPREVVTVSPETHTKEALRLLDRHEVTSMPLVDASGRVVGVVSEATCCVGPSCPIPVRA